MKSPQVGPDHQHRLRPCARRPPFKSAYVAAKHGIAGLTKTVALEVAEHGITVNAICPGYVMTPLVERADPGHGQGARHHRRAVIRDVLLAAQPTKKFVTVEEVAALAVFLAADGRLDHRRGAAHRWRLDRALDHDDFGLNQSKIIIEASDISDVFIT